MKKLKFIIKLLIFIFIFVIALPELGVYTMIFDRGDYQPVDLPPDKAVTSIDQLTPKTREKCQEFLDRCDQEGLRVSITESYRPQERQNMLFEQGRTRPGMIVTWTKSSMHTKRRAFDICQDLPGHAYDDEDFFRRCAEIGKQVGLSPGYYWEGHQDKPHFEYIPWWAGRGLLGRLEAWLASK